MEPEPHNRVSDLYHRALARTPEERDTFLDKACDGDTAVRCEVESLLEYECAGAAFLETPAEIVAGEPAEPSGRVR